MKFINNALVSEGFPNREGSTINTIIKNTVFQGPLGQVHRAGAPQLDFVLRRDSYANGYHPAVPAQEGCLNTSPQDSLTQPESGANGSVRQDSFPLLQSFLQRTTS